MKEWLKQHVEPVDTVKHRQSKEWTGNLLHP